MESGFLVPSGRTTTVWAAYELWSASSELKAGNQVLARYDTAFGVLNPSHYATAANTISRTHGENASPQPFPGAICQLVGTVDTPSRPPVQQRVFGRNRSNDAPGVHAPN